MGSATIAGWIAHIAFWAVLAWAWAAGELATRGVALFLFLWIAGFVAAQYVSYAGLFAPYVAALDVALVLITVKGDIKLT
jgi:hypothetical protein